MNKIKFKNGEFVNFNSQKMTVRYERPSDENGFIACEWTCKETGDILIDWFDEGSLTLAE